MDKLTTALAVFLVMAVSTGLSAIAQTPAADQRTQRTETGNKAPDAPRQAKNAIREHPGGLVQANWLIGSRVHDAEGRDIGKIEELWLDPKDGRVKDVIVSVGATLGVGGRDRLVAWKDVTVAWRNQKVHVSIDPNALRHATEVEKDRIDRGPAASPRTTPKR
jgi:sporulation protein YlmC with PRC-barrel domain